MSLKAQAARGIKWQALEIVGRQILSLLVFATLTRLLDQTDFGLVGLVMVYLAFVTMFADQGIATALVQRKELEPEHINVAFWFNVGCAVVICLATMVLAGQVAVFFKEPKLAMLLRVGSLVLVINALSAVHSVLFLRGMDFRKPMIRTMIANLTGGIAGVTMAFMHMGVWSLIGQQLTTALAGTFFMWSASNWRPKWSFSLKHLRQLLGVSSSVFLTALLWFVTMRMDQVVLGRMVGAAILGEYVLGQKLSDLMSSTVHQPIQSVSMPALSRMQGDNPRICQAIYKGMELYALVAFAIFVGLAAVSEDIVPLVFGTKWVLARSLCAWLSIYMLIKALPVFFHSALLATGGPGGYVILHGFYAAGVTIACLVGIRFGVTTMIMGMIINGLLNLIPAFIFLRKRVGLSPLLYCKTWVVPAIASILMTACILALRWELDKNHPAWLTTVSDALSSQLVHLHIRRGNEFIRLFLLVGCEVFLGGLTYLASVAVLSPNSLKRIFDIAQHAMGFRREATVIAAAEAVTSSELPQ